MKHILLFLCCLVSVCSYAQQGGQKGNVDVTNFPEVSFIWNEYNPAILHSNQFTLKENGQEVSFDCKNIVSDTIPQKNKTVLFLWEYIPTQGDQYYNFISYLLYGFFQNDIINDTTTSFNIAVFDRKQSDESVLKLKLPEFISDKEMLGKFTTDSLYVWKDNQVYNNTYYRKNANESYLFLAIKEGLDLLSREPKNNTRAMVVITTGSDFFVPGMEITPIVNQSLRNKIPIYAIHYPTPKNESKSSLLQLSNKTYGQLILSDGKDDEAKAIMAREELLNCFNELNRRHYGQDYKITFASQLKRDGKVYPLIFNSDGRDYNITYQIPHFSLKVWAKENFILFLILLVLAMAIITLGVIFGIRFLKNRKYAKSRQKQEAERQKKQQLTEQENLKRQLNATKEEFQRQQQSAEQEKKQAREQEQAEWLTKQMHTKNLQARLISINDGSAFRINNAITTIGKSDSNDIMLSDPTVSRRHAQIVFNGSDFEIHDLNSANGTTVNGGYIESANLKNADVIQFGEAIVKFYL